MESVANINGLLNGFKNDFFDLINTTASHTSSIDKEEFEYRMKCELLDSEIALIDVLGKEARAFGSSGWSKIKKKLHDSRTKSERLRRRLEFLSPPNQQEFEAT